MASRFSQSVCVAVQDTLNRCRQADDPLACLETSMEELRSEHWCESDVQQVEEAVRKVLCSVLVTRYAEPCKVG